jgi:hypothetical protein
MHSLTVTTKNTVQSVRPEAAVESLSIPPVYGAAPVNLALGRQELLRSDPPAIYKPTSGGPMAEPAMP